MGELRRLDRRLAFQGEIVDLYKDTVELPDGKIEEWDYVHHKKGGGACVVPVLPDGRILMIRQYRPAIGECCLELPAGCRDITDDGEYEDTAVTARRELQEETGYTSDSITFLCKIRTAIAWCNEFTDIYLARDVYRTGEQSLDEAEDIRVTPVHMEDILHDIRSGLQQDAKTVAGILAYLSSSDQ